MDTNIQNNTLNISNDATKEITTRICKCCGRELPISDFSHYSKDKIRWVCKRCMNDDIPTNPKFKDVTSRELVLELRARGYRGKLTKTVTKDLVI